MLDEEGRQLLAAVKAISAARGEPILSLFEPASLAAQVRELGFANVWDLGPEELITATLVVYSYSYVNNSPNISKMVSVLTVYRVTSLAESDTVQFVMCLGSAGALKVRVHQTWPNGFSGSKQSARSKFFDVRVPAHRAM